VLDVSSRLCDLVLSALGLELRRDLELLLGDGGSQPWLRDLVDARASLSSRTGLTLLDNLVSDQAPDVSLGRETHEPATRCRWGEGRVRPPLVTDLLSCHLVIPRRV